MHGNASQWCLDWSGPAIDGDVVDPVGPETGTQRIKRGGSWFEGFQIAKSAAFQVNNPNTCDFVEGFRVVLEIPTSADAGHRP